MSGALNSTFLQNLANPPAASPQYWGQQMSNMNALQDYQSKMAWGQALQQSTDPTTGTVDYGKAQALAAGNPMARAGMAPQLAANATTQGQQISNTASIYKLTGIAALNVAKDPSDASVNSSFDNMIASGLPATSMNAERQRVLAMSPADRQNYAVQHGLSVLDALHQTIGQTTGQNVGGQIVPLTVTQPTPGGPGAIVQGPGGVNVTQTPENLNQIVQIGTNADGTKRMGTQRQAQNLAAGRDANDDGPTGTTGPGTGTRAVVRDSSGQPVGPNNPPRVGQLNVPAPPGTTPPAPTGGPPAAPAVGGNVGFGAALARPQGAPTAALPVPPVPPTNVPPPPAPAANSTAPIWNPNNPVGTSTVTPPTTNPAIAAAQAQARTSGRPVAVPGIPGMVANPNGSVGPTGGSGFPAPASAPPAARPATLPPNAPTASLQGGVPVASTNALAPNLGTPSAPSPLVPGDVNAIMGGMNQGRVPAQGTQTAANTSAPGFTVGLPTAQESALTATGTASAGQFQNIVQQGVKARSQDALLATMLSEAQGFRPGPGADLASTVKRTILGLGAQFGTTFGVDTDKLAKQESVQKIANQLADAQGAGSDARLAVSEGANPSVHNTPAGLDLIIRQLRGNADYLRIRQQLAAQYPDKGDIEGFESKVGANLDPRVFQYQRLNPQQRTDYYTGLTDKSSFRNAYDWANGKGLLGAP